MQQRHGEARGIQPQLAEDDRDRERVVQIRLAGATLLALVDPRRELVCPAHQRQLFGTVGLGQARHEVLEAESLGLVVGK